MNAKVKLEQLRREERELLRLIAIEENPSLEGPLKAIGSLVESLQQLADKKDSDLPSNAQEMAEKLREKIEKKKEQIEKAKDMLAEYEARLAEVDPELQGDVIAKREKEIVGEILAIVEENVEAFDAAEIDLEEIFPDSVLNAAEETDEQNEPDEQESGDNQE